MAIYHLHADVVHRSLGHSAVAAAAYASGKNLYNDRAEKMEAYGRKRGVFHTKIIAPDDAPEWVYDRQELWNRAERVEKRIDAQPARVFVLALPHECTDEQNIALVDAYVREVLVSEGMVVDIGMHRADRNGDQRNDHVHLVMTMRELDGDAFSRTKNREWNQKETLLHWREQWAAYQNRALEEAGYDTRVDHRTLEEQGIDREPTKHMGREATLMERRGDNAELGDRNREIIRQNQKINDLVHDLEAIDAEIAAEMANDFLPAAEDEEPEYRAEALQVDLIPTEKPPDLSWEEQKREAQRVFKSEDREAEEINIDQTEAPDLSWEEQKREAQSAFKQEFKEGEIQSSQSEQSGLTWEEQKREAQYVFKDEDRGSEEINIDQMDKYPLNWEKQKKEAQRVFKDEDREDIGGRPDQIGQSGLSWEEQKREAQSAFKQEFKEGKIQSSQGEQSGLTWEEQKRLAQSAFNSPIVASYIRNIQERGEVKEQGLGKHWYDRTVVFFENLFYNTIDYLKSSYQKLVDRISTTQDRDIDLEDR